MELLGKPSIPHWTANSPQSLTIREWVNSVHQAKRVYTFIVLSSPHVTMHNCLLG